MTRVDIAADLNSEDETGFDWTYLDEADDPSLIRPRQLVVAGSGSTSAVCEVIDLEERHRPQERGIHVHVYKDNEYLIDDTFGTVRHGGRTLDRSELLEAMIAQTIG